MSQLRTVARRPSRVEESTLKALHGTKPPLRPVGRDSLLSVRVSERHGCGVRGCGAFTVRAMELAPMPEPLRQAVHELVSEAVMNCQEVLRYTEPDLARDWKRMTLIRATDASDTLNMASI